jgi:multiple sugar transport system ATP-binding protein
VSGIEPVNIEIRGIEKSFGTTRVLDGISLDVGADEFVVFLGPSGCGKSTLLRVIAGLERADAGEVRIDGRRIDTLAPGDRGVAMVFQHYALYPHMTVRDNMAFGLRNTGVAATEIDRRVADAARMLEIEALLERKPAQVSGGQRQRVAIGRAIVKEPKLFLFDEPLSNLDAALRVRTRLEIAQLHRRVKAAMIFVTHDQVEAMTLAHRIVVMHGGRIEQIGSPMDIYSRPATLFVAQFVGTPAMNILPVRAKTVGETLMLTLPDGATVPVAIASTGVPRLDGLEANELRLGVRAENVRLVAPGSGHTRGAVKFIERLGDRSLVYVTLADGSTFVAQDAGSSAVAIGDQLGLAVDERVLHLFDARSAWHTGDVHTGDAG